MSKSPHLNPTFSSKVASWLDETSCTPDIVNLSEWDNHHLFVYGSERHGYRLDSRLSKATLCGYGMTQKPRYVMGIYRNRFPYPVALETEDPTMAAKIWGEVYSVTTEELCYIDFMNSNTATWRRKRVAIDMIGPARTRPVLAYMYVGKPEVWDKKVFTDQWVYKSPRNDDKGLPKHYQFLVRDQTDKAFVLEGKS